MSPLIPLLAFLFAPPQDKPPEKCTISGTVVDALTGRALNKVDLRLWVDTDGVMRPSATATATDAKGNFTIAGLNPGHYFLGGLRNGYLGNDVGARPPGRGSGIAIALDAGQEVKDVTLKLLPYSVVAGTVRDADGEPLSGVTISMWAVGFNFDGRSITRTAERDTDDLGQFRFAGVEPGKYYVRAELKEFGTVLDFFAPGVQDPDEAAIVEVGPGARVSGVDIAVQRPRAFRVTVHIAAPAGFEMKCWLTSGRNEYAGQSDYDSMARPRPSSNSTHGEFVFEKVPSGWYSVHASARPREDCAEGVACPGGDTVSYSATGRLEVTDHAIDDFRLNLTAGAIVNAHYTVEGDAKTAMRTGGLHFFGAGAAAFQEDQCLSTELPAGRHVVEFFDLPSGLYVKSMRGESIDVLRDGLTVSGGGIILLEIVLSDGVGALEGAVLDGDEKPVPGATLLLIPEAGLRSQPGRFYSAITDQHGRYHLANVAPGEYKALAFDDVAPYSWFDPDFLHPLEPAAETVTIAPKATGALNLHIRPTH